MESGKEVRGTTRSRSGPVRIGPRRRHVNIAGRGRLVQRVCHSHTSWTRFRDPHISIHASIQQSPSDKTAAYGSGQYFTDLPPLVAATRTKFDMSYALFSVPYLWSKVQYDVAVDLSNLPISRQANIYSSATAPKYPPGYGVYLHASTQDLSVAGRIILAQSGPVAYAGG